MPLHSLRPALVWLTGRIAIDALFVFVSQRLVQTVFALSDSLRAVALASGVLLVASVAVDAVVSFFGFSFVSVSLLSCYRLDEAVRRPATRPQAPDADPTVTRRSKVIAAGRRWFRPARVGVVSVVLIVAGLAGGSFVLESMPDPSDVAISAHRGGPPPAPENTLSALESAIAAKADYTEIDVQRTRDGTIVVIHDADFMRVAGDPRRVARTRFDELADIVQIPDDGSPESERRLATLDDFLERARDRIRIMIELKYYGFDPLLAGAVVDKVREHRMEEQVVIMSLSLEGVRQVQQLAPDIPLGYLSTVAIGDVDRLPVQFIAAASQAVNRGFVRAARQRNTDVHVWTVNNCRAMIDLIEIGVDGLITDDPARAVQVRDELSELTAVERLLLRW